MYNPNYAPPQAERPSNNTLKPQAGFSITELLIVLIIVIILISLAIPDFTKSKQAALDRRAKASLMLVHAAEKIYAYKMGFFYPYTGTADNTELNSTLSLRLEDGDWDFGITSGGMDTFTATAIQPSGRKYQITIDDEDPQLVP